MDRRQNVRQVWWTPLPRPIGKVTVVDTYVNETLTAVTCEFMLEIVNPPTPPNTRPSRQEAGVMDIKELIVGTFEDYWGRLDRALEGLTSEEYNISALAG